MTQRAIHLFAAAVAILMMVATITTISARQADAGPLCGVGYCGHARNAIESDVNLDVKCSDGLWWKVKPGNDSGCHDAVRFKVRPNNIAWLWKYAGYRGGYHWVRIKGTGQGVARYFGIADGSYKRVKLRRAP